MGERRHDDRAARAKCSLLRRNDLDVAQFIAQARIRERLDPIERFPIGGIRHALEQVNGGIPARDYTKARLPAHLARRECGIDALHSVQPRCASRYWRTM